VKTAVRTCLRRAAMSVSKAGASARGTTSVSSTCRTSSLPPTQEPQCLDGEPVTVPGRTQPAGDPTDLRAAQGESVVVKLFAELLPKPAPLDKITAWDVSRRCKSRSVAESGEFAVQATVSPGRVLDGQA
jgi:hypothetical protein